MTWALAWSVSSMRSRDKSRSDCHRSDAAKRKACFVVLGSLAELADPIPFVVSSSNAIVVS
jgi:hypothetical protein